MRQKFGILLSLFLVTAGLSVAQSLQCQPSVSSNLVRGEGLTEQMGEIVLQCTGGSPSQISTGTFTIFLSVPITNKVNGNGDSDAVLAFDNGSGPVISSIRARYQNSNALIFSGVTFQTSPSGSVTIHISNIRGAASYIGLGRLGGQQITASLSVNGLNLFVSQSTFVVAVVQRAFYSSYTSRLICSGYGTPDITGLGFSAAVNAGGSFSTVRVTEGFPSAFAPRSDDNLYNADFGTRIFARFTGIPAGAHIFVPIAVTGSNTLRQTSAGDYGLIANGGSYVRASNTLLLALVGNADSAGGGVNSSPLFNLSNLPSGAVGFDTLTEIIAGADGTATATYEVIDANPNGVESATIPAFVYLPRGILLSFTQIGEDLSLGPVSSVTQTGSTQPVPRFATVTPLNDCSLNGDCGASYFPKLQLNQTLFDVSMTTLDKSNSQYLNIGNAGSGNFLWNASIDYLGSNANGYPWLQLSSNMGLGGPNITLYLVPGLLQSGVYDAMLTIDAGPIAGKSSVRVTMRLQYKAATPLVVNVLNDASKIGGYVVPGSKYDIIGDRFSGFNIGITFNGIPGIVLPGSIPTQLLAQAPLGIQGQNDALIVVTVDNSPSNGILIPISNSAPAVYSTNIINQDGTINGPLNGALTGSTIQVYSTGLPNAGVYSGKIHDRTIDGDSLVSVGPASGLLGIYVMQMIVPADLPAMTTSVYACGGLTPESIVCSNPVDITLTNPPATVIPK